MIFRTDLTTQYKAFELEIDKAIKRVLFSGKYVLDREGEKFEEEFAKYLGIANAIGVGSGTGGLKLSLRVLGIGQGDEVITTPLTAIPTVSAIVEVGANPVFADIDPETLLINLEGIKEKISRKTKAIIPVHLFGNVVDIVKLRIIVGKKIAIIEDACQAHGSKINNQFSGTMGDLGVFSFYPTKNLGGYGDSGMIVTKNKKLAQKIRLIRNYGYTRNDSWDLLGTNSRLDEIQAAVLMVKLKYLDKINSKNNQIAAIYKKSIKSKLFEFQKIGENIYSNYHVFSVKFFGDRQKLINHLLKQKIQTNIYYKQPIYKQKAFKKLGLQQKNLPQVEKVCNQILALPMHAFLSMQSVEYITGQINKFTHE